MVKQLDLKFSLTPQLTVGGIEISKGINGIKNIWAENPEEQLNMLPKTFQMLQNF